MPKPFSSRLTSRGRLLGGLLSAWLAAASAPAQQSGAPAEVSDPWGGNGARRVHSDTGAGYDPHSGVAKRNAADLQVPGSVGAFPLAWSRIWNSGGLQSQTDAMPESFAGGNWQHSYAWLASFDQTRYDPNDRNTRQPTNPYRSFIKVYHPDGASTSFHHDTPTEDPSTDWSVWAGSVSVTDQIEVRDSQANEFWIHRNDGSTVKFQAYGSVSYGYWRAYEIVDPHGLRTTIAYDTNPSRSTCVTRVSDQSGRFIAVNWQAIDGYGAPVIGSVQAGASIGGAEVLAQSVEYKYSPIDFHGYTAIMLTSVRYVNGVGSGQDAWAAYQYNTNLALSYASDPQFMGAMTRIRYSYVTNSDAAVSPTVGIPDHVSGGIGGEQSGDYGTDVTRLAYHVLLRIETRGDGPSRSFTYGPNAGAWPGAHYYSNSGGGGGWVPPEANPNGRPPWIIGKVSDFLGYTQFFRMGATEPSRVWDYLNRSTSASYENFYELLTSFTHDEDGSYQLFERVNAGNSLPRDATALPNPLHCWVFAHRDELGNWTTYTRDQLRRTTRVDHPDGSFEEFQYNLFNQVSAHHLASGAWQYFNYDTRGLLQSATNDTDGTDYATYTYYGPGDHPEWTDRVKTIKTGRSNVAGAPYASLLEYNARGQVTKVHYPATGCSQSADPTVTYGYDNWGNCTSVTDEMNHSKAFAYDEYRRCTSMTEQLDAPAWNGQGSVASRSWDWIYDRTISGYPQAPASSHTDRQWRIQVEPAFNAAGDRRATVQYFDANQRVTCVQTGWWQAAGAPLGSLSYDYGQPTSVTESHSFTYDANGNKASFTDPMGRLTTYTYNKRNWQETMTEPGQRVTTTHYDVAGNKTYVTKPDDTTQFWGPCDAWGQPAWWQDENGGRTDFEYAFGPMKKLAKVYDARHVAEGKAKWTLFQYDPLGREFNRTFPDGTTETKAYAYGALSAASNRWGQTQGFTYDARGRPGQVFWTQNEAPQIGHCWDDAGRLAVILNDNCTLTYAYDSAGQVLTETQDIAGAGGARSLAYRRFPNGTAAHVDYPNGVRIQRSYNARGQLTRVFQADGNFSPVFELVTYTHYSDGKVYFQTHGNGMQTNFAYEERGLVNALQHFRRDGGAGVPFLNVGYRVYTRDDVGRIAWFQKGGDASYNPMENGLAEGFGYDYEGQLVSAGYDGVVGQDGFANPQRTQAFTYDPMGSRLQTTSVPAGVGTRPWDVRPNGLNQQWVAHYWAWLYYDGNTDPQNGTLKGNGCVTAFNGVNFAYNALNQMTAANNYGSTPYTFAYDPLGRLVKRTVNGAPTFFYWDGWNLVQEGTSAASVGKIYVHGARVDELLARYDYTLNAWHFLHYDARGHSTHLTDREGNLVEQYAYDAFGRPWFYNGAGAALTQSAFDNRFLFTGREWLKELQIYDYRHRHYHPEAGRFLQPDPKHFEAGDYNLYRYCHNDPVNKTDPMGLEGTIIILRDAVSGNRDARRDAPGTAYLFENGRFLASFRVNENGYMAYPSGNQSHGIYAGEYLLLPKPASQGSGFPVGTPSITHPDYADQPGRAGASWNPTVRWHDALPTMLDGSPRPGGDSLSCVTSAPANTRMVQGLMERNLKDGGTSVFVQIPGENTLNKRHRLLFGGNGRD